MFKIYNKISAIISKKKKTNVISLNIALHWHDS